MPSNPLRRTRVAFAAALAVVAVLAPGAAHATDKCKIGDSAVGDIRSLASLRAVIDDQCPCATFDGSSPTTNRGAFLKCVKARINDASDGTALLGFSLRKQCKNTLQAVYKLSTCGYGDERVACCEVKPANGKKKASIKKPSSCEDCARPAGRRSPRKRAASTPPTAASPRRFSPPKRPSTCRARPSPRTLRERSASSSPTRSCSRSSAAAASASTTRATPATALPTRPASPTPSWSWFPGSRPAVVCSVFSRRT
jgi:hypothetical protein